MKRISKLHLKKYVKNNYVLSRIHLSEVYRIIEYGHLKSFRGIDKYIKQRFNIAKFKF